MSHQFVFMRPEDLTCSNHLYSEVTLGAAVGNGEPMHLSEGPIDPIEVLDGDIVRNDVHTGYTFQQSDAGL